MLGPSQPAHSLVHLLHLKQSDVCSRHTFASNSWKAFLATTRLSHFLWDNSLVSKPRIFVIFSEKHCVTPQSWINDFLCAPTLLFIYLCTADLRTTELWAPMHAVENPHVTFDPKVWHFASAASTSHRLRTMSSILCWESAVGNEKILCFFFYLLFVESRNLKP